MIKKSMAIFCDGDRCLCQQMITYEEYSWPKLKKQLEDMGWELNDKGDFCVHCKVK